MKTIKGAVIPALACLLALLIAVICFRKIWLHHTMPRTPKLKTRTRKKQKIRQ